MQSEVQVERIAHELPAYEFKVRVTTCENRFEILAEPGVQIDSWWLQATLDRWIKSRIDAQKSGGHNPATSCE